MGNVDDSPPYLSPELRGVRDSLLAALGTGTECWSDLDTDMMLSIAPTSAYLATLQQEVHVVTIIDRAAILGEGTQPVRDAVTRAELRQTQKGTELHSEWTGNVSRILRLEKMTPFFNQHGRKYCYDNTPERLLVGKQMVARALLTLVAHL